MTIGRRHSSAAQRSSRVLFCARCVLGCIVLLVIGVGQSHAILRRSDRSEAEYITLAERYPAVCAVCFDDRLGGSGTLIAPRWVLTAAHVIQPREKQNGKWVPLAVDKKWYVLFNQSLQVPVKRVIEYPGYRKSSGLDVTLLELDHPVEGIAPIPCYAGNQELGQQITVVGFGGQGTIESGPPRDAAAVKIVNTPARQKVKWAGTDVVIQLIDTELLTQVDRPEAMTELEAVMTGGDSGGPALVNVNGQAMVAGVVSGAGVWFPPGTDPNSPYGERNAFARVSHAARWIEDTTGANFGVPRYERIAGLVVGPLLLVGCAWYIKRKRSKWLQPPKETAAP